MKHLMVTVALLIAAPAKAANVDWKYYGAAPGGNRCFYDLHGAVQRRDGHVLVWAKCISQKKIDDVILDKKGVDDAARKVLAGYFPPITRVIDVPFDKMIDIMVIEQIADTGFIEPDARIFFELDCIGKMMRELSIDMRGLQMIDAPNQWQYVAPETNVDRLLKMTCGVRP